MSKVSKKVRLKFLIQSIPMYIMSYFELSIRFCNDLHGMIAKFWWGVFTYIKSTFIGTRGISFAN